MAASETHYDSYSRELVWDIFENAWVSLEWWEWVNERSPLSLENSSTD